MRITRSTDSDRSSVSATTPASIDNPRSQLAFDAALRSHRQREFAQKTNAPRQDGPRKGSDDKSRARPASSRGNNSKEGAPGAQALHGSISAGIAQLVAEEVHARLISLSSAPSAPKLTYTANANYARRRQVGDDFGAGTAPCIEIVLAHGGTRIVISRENQVWLLSFQTDVPLTTAQTQELTEMLRAQFAQRGLGALDIVA